IRWCRNISVSGTGDDIVWQRTACHDIVRLARCPATRLRPRRRRGDDCRHRRANVLQVDDHSFRSSRLAGCLSCTGTWHAALCEVPGHRRYRVRGHVLQGEMTVAALKENWPETMISPETGATLYRDI